MSPELHEFGDVTVDLRRMEVRRAGRVVALEPKSFDVLRLLIENRDRLVTKDELLDVVWEGTSVTPNVLTRAVAQLRKALGDDAFDARYVETVARRGYRFIAPVGNADGESGRAVEGESTPIPDPSAAKPASGRRWMWPIAAGVLAAAALAGVASAWLATRDRPKPPPPTLLRLTTDTRYPYLSPAVSPDGSKVAYSSPQTGNRMEIYLRGLADGSREIPITSDGGGNVEAAFSPDGRTLAYYSRRKGGIWMVPSTGGTPRQLASFGSNPAWKPDGQTIVFSSYTLQGLSSQAELWTVKLDGSPPVALTRPGVPPGGHVNPAWSPDGGLIAFRVGRDVTKEIWIVPAAGGAPRRIAVGSNPAFTPDGRALYWLSGTPDGTSSLMRVGIARDGQPDGKEELIVPFPGFLPVSFTIGPDLTAVFSLNQSSVNLFSIDIGERGEAAAPVQLTFDNTITTSPDYGPTGRIAFYQEGAGRPSTPWVMNDDGGLKQELITGLSASIRYPQWDAQGTRVFTFVDQGTDQQHFAWIDLATRRLTKIPVSASGVAGWPSLSPDGQQVAFQVIGPDGVLNVWVQSLDTGDRRQVTFDQEAMSYPRWSPDGKWLAVNVSRGKSAANVGVVPVDGGPVEHLTSGAGLRWPYSFSPDGDLVAFAEARLGVWNIHTVSRRTREIKQLTTFTTGQAKYPAWSPSGNRIVFERREEVTGLWTLRLPGADLTASRRK